MLTSINGSTYFLCTFLIHLTLISQLKDAKFRDLMGDMGFSGGFETMKAGKDPEGWMEMVRSVRLDLLDHVMNIRLFCSLRWVSPL